MTLKDILAFHQAATNRNDIKALSKVEKSYLDLLSETPDNPQILQLLGTLYMQISKNSLGIQLLERAVSIQDVLPEAWNNLGNAYRIDLHRKKAIKAYKRAVELAPDVGENWNNYGTSYVNEGEGAEGERILKKAVQIDPTNHHAYWNLALCQLEQGKYKEGFENYHHGMGAGIRFERFYNGTPEWDGKPTDHLIVYGEQGIGDEIMYSSLLFMRLSGVKKVSFDCHPRLINMFKRSFPWIEEIHPTRKEPIIDWHDQQKFTARVAIADLPKHYPITKRKDWHRRAYLKESPGKCGAIHLPEGINIGISWKGGKKKTRSDLRSITLEDYLPMFKRLEHLNINWVSMQYSPNSKEEIISFNKEHGMNIMHLKYIHEFDYDWTLALIKKLDQVVSVNTSLVHLCGAAGVTCKVLTPHGKAWRYYSPDGQHMAMYGDWVTLYQQGKDRDWEPVKQRVTNDLLEEYRLEYNH